MVQSQKLSNSFNEGDVKTGFHIRWSPVMVVIALYLTIDFYGFICKEHDIKT